jgi:hypothetical protein
MTSNEVNHVNHVNHGSTQKPGHVVRVVCEFAGSGEQLTAFDFNLGKSFSELRRLVSQSAPERWLESTRLFWNHNGPELTFNPGLFGTQRSIAEKVCAHTYCWLQATEVKQIVVAVAFYEGVDVLVRSNLGDESNWPHTFDCGFNDFFDHMAKLHHVNTSQLLANTNAMYYIAKHYGYRVDKRFITTALRDNLDFMAELPALSYLASPRLLDSEEFAQLCFQSSTNVIRQRSYCNDIFRRLTLRVQSLPHIAVLALRSEGLRVLEIVPKHLFEDKDFVMALILHEYTAFSRASWELRHDCDVVLLCLAAGQKQTLPEKAIAHILSCTDTLSVAHALQDSELAGVVDKDRVFALERLSADMTHKST